MTFLGLDKSFTNHLSYREVIMDYRTVEQGFIFDMNSLFARFKTLTDKRSLKAFGIR
jgi:hypothetical protein